MLTKHARKRSMHATHRDVAVLINYMLNCLQNPIPSSLVPKSTRADLKTATAQCWAS